MEVEAERQVSSLLKTISLKRINNGANFLSIENTEKEYCSVREDSQPVRPTAERAIQTH